MSLKSLKSKFAAALLVTMSLAPGLMAQTPLDKVTSDPAWDEICATIADRTKTPRDLQELVKFGPKEISVSYNSQTGTTMPFNWWAAGYLETSRVAILARGSDQKWERPLLDTEVRYILQDMCLRAQNNGARPEDLKASQMDFLETGARILFMSPVTLFIIMGAALFHSDWKKAKEAEAEAEKKKPDTGARQAPSRIV